MLDFLLNYMIGLDYWIFDQINRVWTLPVLDDFFFWITDLHKTTYFKFISVPLFVFLFIKKFRREGVTLFLILIFTLAANDFIGGKIKKIADRERPEYSTEISAIKRSEADGYSFYSNHAANMFAFAAFVSPFIPSIQIPLYVIAGLVAYSRVYNGVHYPSDIFVGSIVGYLWGFLMSYLAKKILVLLKNRRAIS